MKRRKFVQALMATPAAAPALLAQQPTPTRPQNVPPPPGATEETLKLQISVPDAGADPMPKFFSGAQFAALRKVSEILMPSLNGAPGAIEAQAPEFLDFLIGRSDTERQQVYKNGLDGLNAQAKKTFNKSFSELDAGQALGMMNALHQPWTYEPPADPVARFLRVAKTDIRTATVNSREYSAGKRFTGSGLYWYPLD